MWVALHWVEHDKAGKIDMNHIFDQYRLSPNGTVKGGYGKLEMYVSKEDVLLEVQFSCEPFNNLFWKLWDVFSSYNMQRRSVGSGAEAASRPESSISPDIIKKLFKEALEQPGWTDDKVEDQFPRAGGVGTSRVPASRMESMVIGKRPCISQSAGGTLEPGPFTKRAKLE